MSAPPRKAPHQPYLRDIRRELTFFFNQADAAVGFRSLQGSFEAKVCFGTGIGLARLTTDADPYTDGIINAAARARRIRSIVFSLPPHIRRALEATYDRSYYAIDPDEKYRRKDPPFGQSVRYPSCLIRIFGAKAGCALFQQVVDYPTLHRLCRKKVAKTALTEEEGKIWFLIGEDIRRIWEEIHHAYWLATKGIGCC